MSLALPKDKDLGYKVPAALAKKLERKFSLTSEACLNNAVEMGSVPLFPFAAILASPCG